MKKLLVALVAIGVVAAQAVPVINYNVSTTQGGAGAVQTPLNGTVYGAGVAPLSYTGSTWNDGVNAGPLTDMLDSDGNATTVDIAISAGGTDAVFPWGTAGGGNATMMNYLAIHNSFGAPLTGTGTIALTGLNALGEYRIAIVSQGDNNTQGGTFTIGGNVQVSQGNGFGTALTQGANYVLFASVFADATGNLNISADAGPLGNWAVIDAVQIEAIPEPATIGLIGMFGGAIVFIRRKLAI